MTIQVISVGKPPSRSLQQLMNDYEARVKSYASLGWNFLTPSTVVDESERILRLIKAGDVVVVLDERGSMLDNQQLASRLEGWLGHQGRLVFVIGGAHGVNETVRLRADFLWSLSSLVFPHQLVRLLLVEQLYRSFAVLHNHPYHHA